MPVEPKYPVCITHSINKYHSENNDNGSEKDDIVTHHHFKACKDYDRTVKGKVQSSSIVNLINQIQQPEYTEQNQTNTITNATSKRVMVIEGDQDVGFLFKLVLEEFISRLKVDLFQDPFVALENFRPGLYDLVLIDIVNPKINGFELYYKIKKHDGKVKICLLTEFEIGHYEEITKELLFELNAKKKYFIRKPISNEDLIKQIKEVLEI